MMKKIITLCLLTIGFYSCSKDDDSANETGTKKYVDKVTLEQDGVSSVTNIIYNDAMQVTQYVMDDMTLSLEYEDGRVIAIKDGTTTDPYTLYYTNGILSGLKNYQLYYPVTYNDQDHSYTMDDINYIFGVTGRDVLYAGQPGNYKESFTYDTTKKGPLHDLDSENIYQLTLFSNFQYYYLSAAPIKTISIDNYETIRTYTAQNEYDDEGYLIAASLQSGGEELFNVQYHYVEK